jgi:hypothetical protein
LAALSQLVLLIYEEQALKGLGSAQGRISALERILQKLTFSQIYIENLSLSREEMEFLQMIARVRAPSDGRKQVPGLAKKTTNTKLTDYL